MRKATARGSGEMAIGSAKLPPPIEFTRVFVSKFLSGAPPAQTNEGIGYAALAQRYPHLSRQRAVNMAATAMFSHVLIARFLSGTNPDGPVEDDDCKRLAELYPHFVKQRTRIVKSFDASEVALNARLSIVPPSTAVSLC